MQSSNSNTRRGETTTRAQTAAIFDWVEAEGGRNFKFITRQLASEGVVAGRKLTKQAAYCDLADYYSPCRTDDDYVILQQKRPNSRQTFEMTLREAMRTRGVLPSKDATKQEPQELAEKGYFRPID
jgi:hypothetical protein